MSAAPVPPPEARPVVWRAGVLERRFLAVTVLALVALGFLAWGASGLFARLITDAVEQETTHISAALWRDLLNDHWRRMEAGHVALTRNVDLRRAIRSGSPAVVAEAAWPPFVRLSTLGQISALYVFDRNGNPLYATNPSPELGDLPEVQQALREGTVARGMVIDARGEAQLTTVFPLYAGVGRLAGVGMYAMRVSEVARAYAEASGLATGILDMQGRVLFASDAPLVEGAMRLAGNAWLARPSARHVVLGNRTYTVQRIPLEDDEARVHGYAVTVIDNTALHRAVEREERLRMSGLWAVVALLLFATYRLIVREANRMATVQRQTIEQLEALDARNRETARELEAANFRMWREVVDRQQAREEQGRIARLNAAILEAAGEGVLGVDTDGRVILVNPAAARMLGYSQEELSGRVLHETVHARRLDGSALPVEQCPLHRTIATGETLRSPADCFWRRDGSPLYVDLVCTPLRDASGRTSGAVVVFNDIGDRRRTEDELRSRNAEQQALIQQLKEAHGQLLQSEKMASIGQLAAGVAHEINNPTGYVYSNLGSLSRYVEDLMQVLVAYEAAAGTPPGSPEWAAVERARREADIDYLKDDLPKLMTESTQGLDRVKQIVKDLKDFSRADQGEWQWADLHAGIESTLNVVWNELKYKAEVVREFGRLPQIEMLPAQVNQVLMNLLVNAAHAIEGRGRIVIRTGTEGEGVWFEVEDSGKGIPEEQRKRVFDPFFTTKPPGKGTGLGLSISFGIVRKHNGRITLTSEVGKGSTFRVWLPVRHGADDADEDAPAKGASGGSRA